MDLNQTFWQRIFSLPHSVSLISQQKTLDLASQSLTRSLILTFLTLVISGVFSLTLLYLSFISRRWKGFADSYSIFCASVPLFISGPIFLFLFSLHLHLFPVTQSPFLPSIVLSIYLSAFWFRALSRKMNDYLPQSAVPGARARGLSERSVFIYYVLSPCLGSFMGFFGTQIGTLLNGSVLVEIIFQWRGLGGLLADAVLSRDYPVIEICLMLITLLTLTCQQIGYALQRRMEPKLR